MRNVYLIGMMGSGKTTSGRELARLLGISFVDLDDLIVDKAGRSINEIFKAHGEIFFRQMERQMLDETAARPDQVVATGGGIVLEPANRNRMASTGMTVYLKTALPTLWERVKGKKDRPLLDTPDPEGALRSLFRLRGPLYEAVADKTFLTDRKSPEAVALEIHEACFKGK